MAMNLNGFDEEVTDDTETATGTNQHTQEASGSWAVFRAMQTRDARRGEGVTWYYAARTVSTGSYSGAQLAYSQ
jgi:hypothetical protein